MVANIPHETRDPYLADEGSDESLARYVATHRVTDLARNLYEAQPLQGFRAMTRELRSRTLVGAAAELRTAHLLQINNREVRFVEPSGHRGENFDQVVTYEEAEVAIEVKAKDDSTAYSRSSLRSSLADARKQLPPGGPGIVVLHVPSAWAAYEDPGEVDEVVAEILRNSSRINAIVLVWEQWVPIIGDGYACIVRFKPTESHSPRVPVRRLSILLKQMSIGADSAESRDNVWGCFP